MSRPLSTSAAVDADVEAVYALFTGDDWPVVQDRHLHDGSRLVSVDRRPDGGATMVVSRRLPDGIPGFMQKFAPQDGRVTQTDTWGPDADGVRRGTWAVSFPGSPGQIVGETRIEPRAGGGCTWHVEGTVTVKIPLLGGKVEGFLAPLVEKLVSKQADVVRAEV